MADTGRGGSAAEDARRAPGAHGAGSGGSRLTRFPLDRLWPLVWVVWLPLLLQPLGALLHAQPSPVRLSGTLAGLAIFIAIFVWAAWHNDVSRPTAGSQPSQALWLPIVALIAVSLLLNMNDHTSGWLELFIYVSAAAGARRPRGEAAVAVAVVTVLAAVVGELTAVSGTTVGQTVFLVAVVGAMVIGLGWTTTTRAPRSPVGPKDGRRRGTSRR